MFRRKNQNAKPNPDRNINDFYNADFRFNLGGDRPTANQSGANRPMGGDRPVGGDHFMANQSRGTRPRFDRSMADRPMASQTLTSRRPKHNLWREFRSYYNKNLHVDWALLIIVLIMMSYGLITLFSASMIGSLYIADNTTYFIIRQLAFSLLGIFVIWIVTRVNIKKFDHRLWILIGGLISLALLILVLIPGIGIVIQGARRWLPLPFSRSAGTFQPSEFTKVYTVFYVAWYYSDLRKRRKRGEIIAKDQKKQAWLDAYEDVIKPMIPVVCQLFLISLQAHMSAVIIILAICTFLIASAGVRIKSWFLGGSVALAGLITLIIIVLTMSALFPNAQFTQRWTHVITRINIFTDNDQVTDEQKWQSEQALIAIGSGGVTGVGLGQSRQKYKYLPENHNDYLFSIICEELGLIGGGMVISLFAIFLIAGLRIAGRATTLFSRLIACGYTYLITLQAYLSIGVNLSILPPTGISLPFFSYGGTSNLFFLFGIGLLLSVSKFENKKQLELDQVMPIIESNSN